MTGIVYLIGAGPGDHKLITLKGKECIEKADVIVYDYLADAHFLSYTKEGAEIIYAGKKATIIRCTNGKSTNFSLNAG